MNEFMPNWLVLQKLAIIGNTNFFGLFEKLGGEAHLKKFH